MDMPITHNQPTRPGRETVTVSLRVDIPTRERIRAITEEMGTSTSHTLHILVNEAMNARDAVTVDA